MVARELYTSGNDDSWMLVRESDPDRIFVRHKANLPSGGKETDIELGAFLSDRSPGPQHFELLRLIATLV